MLQPQLNWMLPGMMVPGWGIAPGEIITPPIDVLESNEEVIYIIAIPGVSSEGLKVGIQQQTLEVEGIMSQIDGSQLTYLYRERPAGKYYRLINLPQNIEADNAAASFNHGLLEIRFPKIARGKQIKVSAKTQVAQKKTKTDLVEHPEQQGRNPLL